MNEQDIRQKTSDLFDAYEALIGHRAELNLQDFLVLRDKAIREIDLRITGDVATQATEIPRTCSKEAPKSIVKSVASNVAPIPQEPKSTPISKSHSEPHKNAAALEPDSIPKGNTPSRNANRLPHVEPVIVKEEPSPPKPEPSESPKTKYEQEFARLKSMPDPWN